MSVLLGMLAGGIGFGQQAPSSISPSASVYLDQALQLIEGNSIHHKQANWKSLRNRALAFAAGAQTTQDTYPAIAFVCTQPDTGCELRLPTSTSSDVTRRVHKLELDAKRASHGRPLTASQMSPFLDRNRFALTMLKGKGRQFAYIVIPYCGPGGTSYADPHLRHTWAEDLFSLVEQASHVGVQGWILDLRGNTGGYLAPMLAGTQTLLGEGRVLQYRETGFSYTLDHGGVIAHHRPRVRYPEEHIDETVSYKEQFSPVALLIDHSTQGAAEEVAIAFKGRENIQLFGEQTGGVLDHGIYYDLTDGAILFVPTARTADRNGVSYPEGLRPDVIVPGPSAFPSLTADQAVIAAENWLATTGVVAPVTALPPALERVQSPATVSAASKDATHTSNRETHEERRPRHE